MLTPHPNPYIIEPDPALSRGETGGTVLVIACVAAIAAGALAVLAVVALASHKARPREVTRGRFWWLVTGSRHQPRNRRDGSCDCLHGRYSSWGISRVSCSCPCQPQGPSPWLALRQGNAVQPVFLMLIVGGERDGTDLWGFGSHL
jgi:hypothetical protein